MTAQITIGHESSGKPVEFDIEELLATRLLVQGNSGSGKSHLLRRLLEESAGMVQQVVIDPEGDFPSLADEFGHVVIDGPIDTEWTRERFPDLVKERPEDGLLQPDDIAESYWALHAQKRSAWTFEIDVRPFLEPW